MQKAKALERLTAVKNGTATDTNVSGLSGLIPSKTPKNSNWGSYDSNTSKGSAKQDNQNLKQQDARSHGHQSPQCQQSRQSPHGQQSSGWQTFPGGQQSSPNQNRPNAFQNSHGPQQSHHTTPPGNSSFGQHGGQQSLHGQQSFHGPRPQLSGPPPSRAPSFGAPPKPQVPPSGPTAPSNNKRKVEEKAPNMAQMMKKVKCDSSKDSKDWQKEYEERKRLAMAAYNSKK